MNWADKHLANLERKLDREVTITAMQFQHEIARRWPVDTGTSRRAWILRRTPGKLASYTFSNDVSYSPIIWQADRPEVRKPDNIRWWHSRGGQPILNKVRRLLTKRIKDAVS